MSDRKLISEIKLSPKAKITPEEDEALLYVRSLLAGGTIKQYHGGTVVGQAFNMSVAFRKKRCGTVGCIGGYMGNYLGVNEVEYVESVYQPNLISPPIDSLFCPRGIVNLNLITTHQAIKAIDNFRETGDPQWAKVCPELGLYE